MGLHIFALLFPLPNSITLLCPRAENSDEERGRKQGFWVSLAAGGVGTCEKLNIGLSSRWRLPNVKELRSLVNEGTHNPAADTGKFPEMHSAPYWTSTTYVSSTYSYCVNFTAGVVGY
ncbi:MAG: DUF1566 domain-containing protein, partial [Nitrospinota bacterium]